MHKCQYGDAIGRVPEKITDEKGTDRCGFCHVEWAPKSTRAGGK